MTDSENSQPQDDSDEDIYKDIPEFNLEEELAKLEGSKEIYKQEANDLTKRVKALTQENKELTKLNEVLKKNLSTLLKTAQAEVQRKDSVIEELRCKVESFAFRRNKKSTSDKFTSTDDLIPNPSCKQDSVKQKSSSEEKRTSIGSEWRCNQNNERKTVLQPGKEEKSNCGKKKSDYQRGNAQNTNFGYLESNEKPKERKSSRYEDSSDHRRPFRENDRDHLYDKKRHSRSSDNRFLSRRRSSRERERGRRRSESWERRKRSHRRDDSSERSTRGGSKKEKSRSRESKDNELVARIKEAVEASPQVSKHGNGPENKRRTESIEKKRNTEESVVGDGKNKQNKEKVSGKSDRRKNMEIFSVKSPLDALYGDMVASRSFSQFSNSKGGTVQFESGPEVFESGREFESRSPVKEDWSLSFKNERQNETKPMTLYSRRMMQKFSSESKEKHLKNTEGKEAKEETERPTESKSMEQFTQPEKEPGELTDDDSVPESREAFQALTKVAPLESQVIKSPATEHSSETFALTSTMEAEPSPKDSQMQLEKMIDDKEGPGACEKSSFTRGKRRASLKKATERLATDKRKRKLDDEAEGKSDSKKLKLEKSDLPRKSMRTKANPKSGCETQPVQEAEIKPRQQLDTRINQDYSSCEFFSPMPGPEVPEAPVDFPINKCPLTDYKIAATMSVTGVVRLETPNKCMPNFKNLMINEQMILNILDSKSNCQFSPLVGPKSIQMTPGRMLSKDLMLTDSEDDSLSKRNAAGEDIDEAEEQLEEGADGSGFSGSECSGCGSDSGASDFVDLL